MWNDSKSGGFMPNSSQETSASKKKDNVKRVQSLVPVFISYLNETNDEEFTLYNMPVQMVHIVGVLRKFEVQSTKASCVIEDHSGSIEAVLWLEADNDSVYMPPVKENCYVEVFGTIRHQDGGNVVMILKIFPVDDLNVLSFHKLRVLQARLYGKRAASGSLPPIQNMNATANNTLGNLNMSVSELAAQSSMSGLKPIQAKIMDILKTSKEYMGPSRTEILGHFNPSQAREVRAALDFLLDEGYAYTTCDSDHLKATDGF